MEPPFAIVPPTGAGTPVVAHVPHASTVIQGEERARIVLDDTALALELVRMTDWHTARLFGWAVDRGATAFIHQRSRLVMDPERFADQSMEPMEAFGQGAVYTRTSDGVPLRLPDPAERERTIASLYVPYHAALSALVAEQVERYGQCTILDCHSFGTRPLPSEVDQSPDRPDICIGTDAYHTPPDLAQALEEAFRQEGLRVRRDSPFDGALVPLDRYRTDLRVRSVMIEVRRGLYCDESTGEPGPAFDDVRSVIERAVVAAELFDHSGAPM